MYFRPVCKRSLDDAERRRLVNAIKKAEQVLRQATE
jgi:hypothetical protein